MSAPAPTPGVETGLTLGAVEGALLSVAATEGAYLVGAAGGVVTLSPLMALGLALTSFAGYLGYKAYRGA